jgi:hypothetical protein
MTAEQIRTRGLKALRQALGRAGTLRFLDQFATGSGDYARERHKWVDTVRDEDLLAAVWRVHRARTHKKNSH